MHKIRGYTNDIVETKNGGGYFKKDFTDFIMLDRIYQTAYTDKSIDTYIIFTGDGHFSSAVLFLKNVCGKNVVVYGVKNAFSGQLKTASSAFFEIDADSVGNLCRMIISHVKELERDNPEARPTFMKTIDTVSAKTGTDKAELRRAMERLIDEGCVTQYVKKFGKNDVKLLKFNYDKCSANGYTEL